jgi:hypothetical protein
MNVGRARRARPPTWSAWLAAVTATLAALPSARAADQVPAWAKDGVESARESFTQKSQVAEGYDRGEIVKLLFPKPLVVAAETVEAPWLLFVKPWKASPELSVAVLQTVTYGKGPDAVNETASTLYIAVFAGGASGAKIEIKARGQVHGVAERYLREIDVAPYRLAPDKLAFGVRTWMNWPMVGGGGNNEYLLLFVPDGQGLKTVWATLMQSWSMSNDGYREDPVKNVNDFPGAKVE